MHNLTRGLLDAGHQVKVLCISTPKHPLDARSSARRILLERTRIEGIFVDTSLNVVDAFTDLMTADNYNISRFFSPDMDIRLIRLLTEETFDIVQLGKPVHDAVHPHPAAVLQGPDRAALAQPGACASRSASPPVSATS